MAVLAVAVVVAVVVVVVMVMALVMDFEKVVYERVLHPDIMVHEFRVFGMYYEPCGIAPWP